MNQRNDTPQTNEDSIPDVTSCLEDNLKLLLPDSSALLFDTIKFVYEVFNQEEYISGLQSSIIIGLDYHLPKRYVFNLQVRAFSGSAVSIGISQVGFLNKSGRTNR